ncbi:MAG TPA: hypothetical protein VFQ73_06145 [Flavisolibacter sp.]|jgi:hypothetical protein|nr:hypothetical protein [Flavisolibacter sp.]
MKSYLFTVVIFLSVAFQKQKLDRDKLPACVVQKIQEIKQQPRWNPPAEVHEYFYRNKRVFYFTSDCCDQYNLLLDEQCAVICAPNGGTTGKGDGKCADFNTKAEYIKLVWKDERAK